MLQSNSMLFRQQLHTDVSEVITASNYLNELANGNMDRKEWSFFLAQRYHATVSVFLDWLVLGENLAIKAGFTEMALEIRQNYLDEIGQKHDGSTVKIGAHSEWRKVFYASLGITDINLKNMVLLSGTKACLNGIKSLLIQKNILEIVGALTWWEYYLVEEFKRIDKGMESSFPHLFKITPTDHHAMKKQKQQNSRYIKHHISHDFHKHFPDLERVIMPFLMNDDTKKSILSGMQKIKTARLLFWQTLNRRV